MYTNNSIDLVRNADIVKVVASYCPDLKKNGANYKCKSPFTEEKTPSFVVSPSKQIFKCFSTGIGGDAIAFVQQIDRCEFIDAVKTIAGICNIYLTEEKVPEEVKRQRKQKGGLIALANNVAHQFVKNYNDLDKSHWAKQMVKDRGFTAETCIDFTIGYAEESNQVTTACSSNGKLASAIEIGLSASGQHGSYDPFKNRLIFPIHNTKGAVVGFGGRRQNGENFEKVAKYINSKESTIYDKSAIFYGLFQNKRTIATEGYAVLTEGYTDVVGLYQHDVQNAVASCGTALTKPQAAALRRYCEHVVILRDSDKAGIAASIKDIDIFLAADFKVSICLLPEGEDPDSFAREIPEIKAWILDTMQDALLWRAEVLYEEAAGDSWQEGKAFETICNSLYKIKNEATRNAYIKKVAAILKVTQSLFKSNLAEKLIRQQEKNKQAIGKENYQQLGLPKGADPKQYMKDRFCIIDNQCYFQGNNGFFPGTQFKIKALFHIKGRKENKRLCEITNVQNKKELVDFDSETLVNFGEFKRQLIRVGYFQFLSGTNTSHFDLFAQKILKEFNTALELQTMGWNSKGFFAFANGVFWKDEFKNVNKYGIVYLEGVDTDEEDEYTERVEYYYSPAFSVMHRKNQDGDDPYENDRKFVYKQSPISLREWMEQMVSVFGNKGRLGIVFNFAALFRDLFLKNYTSFPLLGGFGEKGSGKSGFGRVIQNFFFFNEEPLELNQSTLVGLNRRLSRTTNTVTFLDEYNNKLIEAIIQALKGTWGGTGREKGMATQDKRTLTDKINQAVYYAGQYLPTADDNALQTRTICMQFPLKNRTAEEKERFNKLIEVTNQGLSSLLMDIIKHRQYFIDNLTTVFNQVVRSLKNSLKKSNFDERIFTNYAMLLVTLKILESKLDFPFSYDDFYKQCVDGVIENSESVADSNGLTEFWMVLQWLFEHGGIKPGIHFRINKPYTFKTIGTKGEEKVHNIPARDKRILFLRLNTVHQDYVKEVSKREGVDVIGETTLRNYFKSRPYFIGLVRGRRFDKGVYSCYAFDYDMMFNNNTITLHEDIKILDDNDSDTAKADNNNDDDLPF